MELCKCSEPIKWDDAFTESFLQSRKECAKCFVEGYWKELEQPSWKENDT